MMKNTETLSPESLALLGEYSCDCEQVKRHTKPSQFGDIDATLESTATSTTTLKKMWCNV
jgi:hypothetical protein